MFEAEIFRRLALPRSTLNFQLLLYFEFHHRCRRAYTKLPY